MHIYKEFMKTLKTEGEVHDGWAFNVVDGDENLVQGYYMVGEEEFKFDVCYEHTSLKAAFTDSSGCTTFSCELSEKQSCSPMLFIILAAIGFAVNTKELNK